MLHLVVLAGMAAVTVAHTAPDAFLAIESLFSDDDRPPEEFSRELSESTQIADSINLVEGSGAFTGAVGGSGAPAVQQTKIEESTSLRDPTVTINVGDVTLPGIEMLGRDLGAEQVTGDVGAVVEGYGPALDRITQELMRLMRDSKVLVVWLFDESESMKDDQADLRSRIHKVYEELKLFDTAGRDDVLLSAIVSYGKEVHYQLPKGKPTDDLAAIEKAIDSIPNDKTGIENTCQAIISALGEYRRFYTQGRRKVVVIVVSDESGDDGDKVEEALHLARGVDSPIYFLGRESVFGSLYAHIRWIHPQTGGEHWLPIRRGPETPYAELLQFDGFRRRYDAALSGFGPYEQSRLSRNTGGIYFVLPNEDQNVIDPDARKYAALDMKEYEPDIGSRREYMQHRDKSPFRRAIWETIVLLNPYEPRNREMEIPVDHWYSINPAEAKQEVTGPIGRCLNTFQLLTEAERRLKSVQPQRESESSLRWRADYDLILAQVMAYRVRLFQYMMALDQFSRSLATRKFHNKATNRWTIDIGGGEMLPPDEQQLRTLKVSADELENARQAALKQFARVQQIHPKTPWAQRAAWEQSRGFGMRFGERVVVPSTRPPPTTPVAPPPNL